MPKKSMENLTESMLYVLMAFHCRPSAASRWLPSWIP